MPAHSCCTAVALLRAAYTDPLVLVRHDVQPGDWPSGKVIMSAKYLDSVSMLESCS